MFPGPLVLHQSRLSSSTIIGASACACAYMASL